MALRTVTISSHFLADRVLLLLVVSHHLRRKYTRHICPSDKNRVRIQQDSGVKDETRCVAAACNI